MAITSTESNITLYEIRKELAGIKAKFQEKQDAIDALEQAKTALQNRVDALESALGYTAGTDHSFEAPAA
jgi:predicted  nucleic acid-binding Zn-ribbon protein